MSMGLLDRYWALEGRNATFRESQFTICRNWAFREDGFPKNKTNDLILNLTSENVTQHSRIE